MNTPPIFGHTIHVVIVRRPWQIPGGQGGSSQEAGRRRVLRQGAAQERHGEAPPARAEADGHGGRRVGWPRRAARRMAVGSRRHGVWRFLMCDDFLWSSFES